MRTDNSTCRQLKLHNNHFEYNQICLKGKCIQNIILREWSEEEVVERIEANINASSSKWY